MIDSILEIEPRADEIEFMGQIVGLKINWRTSGHDVFVLISSNSFEISYIDFVERCKRFLVNYYPRFFVIYQSQTTISVRLPGVFDILSQ